MKWKLTDNKQVYNFCEPYVIAELGANHNGDMDLARKLIASAKEAGANCVKFQSWTKDSVFSRQKYEENVFLADDYRERTDYTMEDLVDAYSMSEQQLKEMNEYAEEMGVDFASTPFSKAEADFLTDDLKVPFLKVASMDVNNLPFLDYVARKGLPIVLSTGLSDLSEIDAAVRTIEAAGNTQIVLLHCVASYPPKDEEVNLRKMETLRLQYPYPVGFSDHTFGTAVPLAAVALGACVLEKHFTLDKTMEGWDHKVSAEPDELAAIVENSKRVHHALGNTRIAHVENAEQQREFRRSIVTTKDLKAGDELIEKDLDYKRPGTGVSPSEIRYVIGRKLAVDIGEDRVIQWEDLI